MFDNDFLIYLFKFNNINTIIKLFLINKNYNNLIKKYNLHLIAINHHFKNLNAMNQYFFKEKLCVKGDVKLLNFIINNNITFFGNEQLLLCIKNKKYDMAQLISQKYKIDIFEVKTYNQTKTLTNFTFRILSLIDNKQYQEFSSVLNAFTELINLTSHLSNDKEYIFTYICMRYAIDKDFLSFLKLFIDKKILNFNLVNNILNEYNISLDLIY